jgi:hypothetical protein
MAHSLMLHVRVDDEIKAQATEAVEAMGAFGVGRRAHLAQARGQRPGLCA